MADNIQKILEGCIAGKLKAQEKLYNLYARKMFGVALLYTKDYLEAEDIVQESFVKVFRNIEQFQNRGSVEGWIRKIIVNTSLQKYRRQNHLFMVDDFDQIYGQLSFNDLMEDNITVNELLEFIHELPTQYRVVFNLYAIEGYNHQEISEMLNISEGGSKSNLSRARKILQQKVLQYYEHEIKETANSDKICENYR